MRRLRSSASLFAALCCLAAPAIASPDEPAVDSSAWGVAQLMLALKQVKSASAQFTERKTMQIVSTPLISTGTLTYIAPDRMQKLTLAPKRERFVLEGDRVTVAEGTDQAAQRFSLADYPQIGGLVEGIRATLAGDLLTLDHLYRLQLTGKRADWQLLLRPKDAALAHFVSWIRIDGSGDRIRSIDTEEGDGDYSEMSIIEDVRDAR